MRQGREIAQTVLFIKNCCGLNGLVQLKRNWYIMYFFSNNFFVEMECLLCHFQSVLKLKEHYQNYHFIDPKDEKCLNLFKA